jgi:hypothetical protein
MLGYSDEYKQFFYYIFNINIIKYVLIKNVIKRLDFNINYRFMNIAIVDTQFI